jgi:glycosyltransferase involved in cell wall biosynthesis
VILIHSEVAMLTILVDVQCLQGEDTERGIPRWTLGFLNQLRNHECVLVALQNPKLKQINIDLHSYFDEVTVNSRTVVRDKTQKNKCVYLVPSPFEPVRPLSSLMPIHITDSQIPIAVVIYDMTPYLFSEFYQTEPQDERIVKLKEKLFEGSTVFLCISMNTARDLQKLWKIDENKIYVIGTGVSTFFYPVEHDSSVMDKFSVHSPYIFCIGRRDPRKQTLELISAFAELKKQYPHPLQLVIACNVSSETRQQWEDHVRALGVQPNDVVITGTVTDTDLRIFYSNCQLFVEPSLYEGFGYPPAEAAACGAVVITSNTSSLPEVLQNPDATFDPKNRRQIVELMDLGLHDEKFRLTNRTRSKAALQNHTWKVVCDKAFPALLNMAQKVNVPHRALGELAPLGTQFETDIHATITEQAVERFYASEQFDSDRGV